MENNRRKSERISISLEVVMESSSGRREVRLSDLSEGGCFVDSISIISDHEDIWLKVRMPTGEWIDLHGEVVSLFPGIGFGVRFTPSTKAERSHLEQLVQVCGGKLSDQGQPATVQPDSEHTAGQKESLTNSTGAPFSEFEQFLGDLLGEPDDKGK
jgi:hypothetical protein